jgi:hypothetical protein
VVLGIEILFWDCFGYSVFLLNFHVNFRINLSFSATKSAGDLTGITLILIDLCQFREYCHF